MKSTLKIDELGNKYWLTENGEYHREDGPAIEYTDGSKHYFQNNIRHRLDGPAREYSDWYECNLWYFNGKIIPVSSQEEFEQYLRILAFV